MKIQKIVNSKILAKKLSAMFDYIVWLELHSRNNFILIGDRHGTDSMECKPYKHGITTELIIKNKVDRRELTKKLKAMTEAEIVVTFDNENPLIIMEGIRTKEQCSYFCSANPAKTMEEANGNIKWDFDLFKKILGIK